MRYTSAVRRTLPLTLIATLLLATSAHAAEVDFSAQVDAIFDVALCGGGAAPARYAKQKKGIAAHCTEVETGIAEYKKKWLDVATPFIAGLRPAGLPDKVVYPYAGGDLLTALVVFPDATEFTTISLESAGDPRGIDTLDGKSLLTALKTNRHNMLRLLKAAFSATTELAAGESSDLPGQLMIALLGLKVHGYEPVSLRYFTLDIDGKIHYVTAEEIAEHDKAFKKKGKKAERELRISIFSNAEFTFRKAGDAGAPLKTYRHFAANLYDEKFAVDSPLMKYLVAKGPVAAMTKAASHLLWYDKSSHMRGYLLAHMVWMITDSTGIPHDAATAAGFEQITYGDYAGSFPDFEAHAPKVEKAFVKLWKDSPHRELGFRFGYFDKNYASSLMVTQKPAKKK